MKFTQAEVETAVRNSKGFISKALKLLNDSQPLDEDKITFQALSQRIKKNQVLKDVMEEVVESRLDIAEEELDKLVKTGELGAICFILKCKGKDRGYFEKQVNENIGGEVKFYIPKNGKESPQVEVSEFEVDNENN